MIVKVAHEICSSNKTAIKTTMETGRLTSNSDRIGTIDVGIDIYGNGRWESKASMSDCTTKNNKTSNCINISRVYNYSFEIEKNPVKHSY